MAVDLLYGKGRITAQVPPGCTEVVIRKEPRAPIADPAQAIADVLAQPTGAPPLTDYARGKRSACILICDVTRPVPNRLFLRPLIKELMAAGIPCRCASRSWSRPGCIVRTRAPSSRQLVGDPWVLATVRVENHFARDDAAHVDLGRTKGRGVPVKLDRRFVEAEVRIATGLVEPHFMAGYSGGRKVVAPGIAHADTIRTFHSAPSWRTRPRQCNLAGNPLHEEQLEIIRMLGDVLALNTVIDEQRELVFVSFGEIIASHLAAVRFVGGWIQVPVPRRFNTVVTSAAGFPLDQTYYQTVKGMVTPLDILAPGGTLIVASDCSEGIGSKSFRDSQRRLVEMGPDRFLQSILPKPLAGIDEWQTEMQLKALRAGRVQLFTRGLPAADHELTGVEIVPDLDRAIDAAVAASGEAVAAFIPEGPYVIPKYAGA